MCAPARSRSVWLPPRCSHQGRVSPGHPPWCPASSALTAKREAVAAETPELETLRQKLETDPVFQLRTGCCSVPLKLSVPAVREADAEPRSRREIPRRDWERRLPARSSTPTSFSVAVPIAPACSVAG